MATPAALLGHGGRLGAARTAWPDAPTPWLDLSTGINPCPYPVPALAPEAWSRLPDPMALQALERSAAQAFGVEDPARVVAAPGSVHADPALLRGQPGDVVAGDHHRARVEVLEPDDCVAFVLLRGCLQITRQRAGEPASYCLHATPRAPLVIINPGTYTIVAERSAVGLRGVRRRT